MGKTIRNILIILVLVVVVIVILLHNKSKIKAAENVVKISSYPVKVDTVKTMYFTNHLNLVGTIKANNDVPIVSEAKGKVTKVSVEVGDYKKAGSVLIQLEDDLEYSTFKTSEVNYQKAKKDFARYQSLYQEKSATDAQLENAKLALQSAEAQYIAAKKHYNDTHITTPISGIVTAKNVDLGDYVTSGRVVAEVVDISSLKIIINVAEQDVFNLRVGDKVNIITDIYPGVTFDGKIKTISDKGDAAHTYPVEVDFSNSKKHPLKAGMFAHVMFKSKDKNKSLVIPRDALVGSIKDAQVFVLNNNIVKLRSLVIGTSANSELEVISGLKKGDVIVVDGQNNLKNNFKVKVIH